jgi:hypothetical protein
MPTRKLLLLSLLIALTAFSLAAPGNLLAQDADDAGERDDDDGFDIGWLGLLGLLGLLPRKPIDERVGSTRPVAR